MHATFKRHLGLAMHLAKGKRHFCNKQVSVCDAAVLSAAAAESGSCVMVHVAKRSAMATVPDCKALTTGFSCACNRPNGVFEFKSDAKAVAPRRLSCSVLSPLYP